MDDAPVIKATGKALEDWFTILAERGARSLPHKEIARLLHDEYGVPGWWSQSVTVEYEKEIGRRDTGQRQSGEYTTTSSKTLSGDLDEVLDRWLARLPSSGPGAEFDGVAFAVEPSISRTEKWRYWRVGLADGSRVTVYVSAKPNGAASLLAVEHGKLAGRPEADRWRSFWKAYLSEL